MKLKILFLAGILWSPIASGQTLSFGGAAIYGDDIMEPGIHVRGYYNPENEKTCFGPEFSYFIESSKTVNGYKLSKQLSEVNFNLHYIFEVSENWGVYPLLGLNMSFEKEELTDNLGTTETERKNAFGANLGIGVHCMINKWTFFAEYDHLFSELSQNSYLLGAFFTFGKPLPDE